MKILLRIGPASLFFVQLSLSGFAQSGIISTYVGPGLPVNGSQATTQAIDGPLGVVSDGTGGFYIASGCQEAGCQNRVYRVAADGKLTFVAGTGARGYSGDGGPATVARLYNPTGLTLDSAGNLYIADKSNHRIRKVTAATGVISTVAGSGNYGYSGDGGPATVASLDFAGSIAVDSAGNLYIADAFNNRVRKVTAATGVISTVAGDGTLGSGGGDGGPATEAQLRGPSGVAVDSAGNLYIADSGMSRIRKVSAATGIINTIATAQLEGAVGMAVDAAGNVYIPRNHSNDIIKVTAATGMISTVAGGNYVSGFGGDGGPATAAELNGPYCVAADSAGNLYIADAYNNRVRKVTAATGVITTVAGNGTYGYQGDGGPATAALLNSPYGVAVDSAGNLYIADSRNNRIRKVTAFAGEINTVAGNGVPAFGGDGGPAAAAQIYNPCGVAVDSAGNLYIAEFGLVRKVTAATGVISTVAGKLGFVGYGGDGGPAAAAELNGAVGVAVDSAGNLYIADELNNRVRKVTAATGVITTAAGNGTSGYFGDGGPATAAQLFNPTDVAVDFAGNLYIADNRNHRIRKVTAATGVITTAAGNGNLGHAGDGGAATAASLDFPNGMAVDFAGNLYIADTYNTRIRKVTTATGVINTVAGDGTDGYNGDGGPATAAQLDMPSDVAVDAAGNLYIADNRNHRIRKVEIPSSVVTVFPQIVVGNGWSTLFTATNTGSTPASGVLSLTDQQGIPFTVNGVLTDSSGATRANAGSSFEFTVPSGGTIFLLTTSLDPKNPAKAGWAELDSTGGSLSAVATYEYAVGAVGQTMVGVLQSQPLQYATIPVNNDAAQTKQLAYAICNPGSQPILVKLALVSQDGTVVDDTVTIPLGPKQQVAAYLWENLPARSNFRGSLVLRAQAGATFAALGLLEKQGIFTVIPLIPGKAPGVPD